MNIDPALLDRFFQIEELPEAHVPRVIPGVFSLLYPQVATAVAAELRRQAEDGLPLLRRNFTGRQEHMHLPFLRTWREWSGVKLGDAFPHAYPLNGSSEGIAHAIMPYAAQGGVIRVFEGEYEGYGKIVESVGDAEQVIRHDRRNFAAAVRATQPDDEWWISEPSSIDGEHWNGLDSFLEMLWEHCPSAKVNIDLAYVGAVKEPRPLFFARHPNVQRVLFSLSKPFGVYYFRVGGMFTREPVDSLYGNRWFKNVLSLQVGTELMRRYTVNELPLRYRHRQDALVQAAKQDGLLPRSARSSNVILLAHGSEGEQPFRRAEGQYRWCLTPGLDEAINGGDR